MEITESRTQENESESNSKVFQGGQIYRIINAINESPNTNHVSFIIKNLKEGQLKNILQEIYPKCYISSKSSTVKVKLDCLPSLLLKWKDYYYCNYSNIEDSEEAVYRLLTAYLKENLNYIQSKYDEFKNKQKSNKKSNFTICVNCTQKKLKTIFYYDFHPKYGTLMNLNVISQPKVELDNINTKCFLNWPSVGIRIVFENFEFYREIKNNSQYKIVNLNKQKATVSKLHNNDLWMKAGTKTTSFKSIFISKYVEQVKECMIKSNHLFPNKKNEAVLVLSEIQKDLQLCHYAIETNTLYCQHLNRHSYVRYLGQPLDGLDNVPNIKWADQVALNGPIRLQEKITPVLNFSMSKFSVRYVKDEKTQNIKFLLDDKMQFAPKNGFIYYICTLCDCQFSGFLATYELAQHILNEHGAEPDWNCVNCNTVFTNKILMEQRWTHTCPGL